MAEAAKGGAMIVKKAQDTFWGGYAGCFKDPDGHLWEIVWNPQMLPETVTDLSPGSCISGDEAGPRTRRSRFCPVGTRKTVMRKLR